MQQLIVQFSRAHESRALANTRRFPRIRPRFNRLTLVLIFPFIVPLLMNRSKTNTGNILRRLIADGSVPSVVVPRNPDGQVTKRERVHSQ